MSQLQLDNIHRKALELYYTKGYQYAWAYWRMMNKNYGIFLGEVPATEFITGDDLASSIGLTEGTSQYSDTAWLKFALDDNIIYIPKKPIRHSITWEQIYQAGAVYGTNDFGLYPLGNDRIQNAMVSIGSDNFKVTLLKGANSDSVSKHITGWDVEWTHGSEWNRLIYPIHSGIHTDPSNPRNPSTPYTQWSSYSDEDLLVHRDLGGGCFSWCQEKHPDKYSYRIGNGYFGVADTDWNIGDLTNTFFGFRPALRLVR